MGTTPFEQVTTATRDVGVPGRYTAVMTDRWNAPILPHGGVATALALRAAATELAVPDQPLRTLTAVFAAQVPAGPVEIDVEVLRRGRSMSQVSARLRAAGETAGHHVLAAFGAPRPGFEFTEIRPPDVPGPEESRPFQPPPDVEPMPGQFWEQVEGRLALGIGWWEPPEWWRPGPAERAHWYRFHETPRRDDGAVDPLALVALCDTMPGSVFQRMGPDVPECFVPSVDLTVHLFQDATSEWLLAHNHARYSGDGYASLENALWDPERGLVAWATQLMFYSFPDGPPAPHQVHPPS